MKHVKKIAIVGSGTAGLVAAIILKIRLDVEIDIIYSDKIGIIGVGEGSTEHWKDFSDFVGFHHSEFVKECDATYKLGIMFDNWSDKRFLHSVQDIYSERHGQYAPNYARQIAYQDYNMIQDQVAENKISTYFLENQSMPPANQFHFNTHKLNSFLTRVAKHYDINFIEDDINEVELNEQGEIHKLFGNKSNYENYDFYIDCTGFNRILMKKLGAKWNSYSKFLKMKSAIVFPTEEEQEINLWTLSKAMKYGWLFRIPVQGRYGNGYIFDSDYINIDKAKQEVDEFFGRDIEVSKQFNFDPGALDEVWIKNCCAIGLSSSFVEPLEATSIGTSIQQAFLLMHRLPSYDDKVIESYNKSFTNIMENIRDFISLHYVTKKTESQFWKDISAIELPESLKSNLETWKHKLPIHEDFSNSSDYALFGPDNFILVMEGLNLFDRESIKKEYEQQGKNLKNWTNNFKIRECARHNFTEYISHREFIERLLHGH